MSELISKEKVIRLINDAIDNAKTEFFESEWVRGEVNGLGVAKDIILSGQCDPDPVPTIKPGDKVRYKRNSAYGLGEVKGIDASVKFEALAHSTRVSPEDLEVVKDE